MVTWSGGGEASGLEYWPRCEHLVQAAAVLGGVSFGTTVCCGRQGIVLESTWLVETGDGGHEIGSRSSLRPALAKLYQEEVEGLAQRGIIWGSGGDGSVGDGLVSVESGGFTTGNAMTGGELSCTGLGEG